jgi:hypothetical protein
VRTRRIVSTAGWLALILALPTVTQPVVPTWAAFSRTTANGPNSLAAASSFYKATVLADGPAAYWRFGEASGATTAVDATGAANANYLYAPTLGVQGALANDSDTSMALAVSGGVYATDPAALRPTTQVSIEAWIKPSAFTPTQWVVTKNLDYYLYYDNGAVIFGYRTPAFTYPYTSSTAFTVGAWQHVVGTYDGSAIILYRNGVAVAGTPSGGGISVTAGNVDIGHFQHNGWYSGGIDELAVYRRRLTAGEVLRHYERGALTRP